MGGGRRGVEGGLFNNGRNIFRSRGTKKGKGEYFLYTIVVVVVEKKAKRFVVIIVVLQFSMVVCYFTYKQG